MLSATAQSPIIARIVEAPEPGLGEIMMAALGLSGMLAVATLLVGVLVAVVIFWVRSRSAATQSNITRPDDPS